MSIQQSINQMLVSAQIGAGFYTNSPLRVANELKKEYQKNEAQYLAFQEKYQNMEGASSQWAEPMNDEEITMYDKISQRQVDLASRLYDMHPTEANYKQYKDALSGLTEEAYEKYKLDYQIENSLADKFRTKKSTKEEFNKRKAILKGGKKK